MPTLSAQPWLIKVQLCLEAAYLALVVTSSIHLQAIMLYPFTLKQVNLMVLTDLSAVDKF
ncbi:hypothetical protein Patl1_04949 [Pistacia atlantica]|uniref:Uncharacterized protein n=1 Tax=Pistacia atlantica TaxID=434234 RepID=A0ACC1BUC4_9ROSI|nr:hypothetical protein Patl1_04949 [Pistacia atlantica]